MMMERIKESRQQNMIEFSIFLTIESHFSFPFEFFVPVFSYIIGLRVHKISLFVILRVSMYGYNYCYTSSAHYIGRYILSC